MLIANQRAVMQIQRNQAEKIKHPRDLYKGIYLFIVQIRIVPVEGADG